MGRALCILVVGGLVGWGCRPSAEPAEPAAVMEPAQEERALVERGPFLALHFAREALARRDFEAVRAHVAEHRRLAADDWLERIDLELVVACWTGDEPGLVRLTRDYVERVCRRADEGARPHLTLRSVEPMCFVREYTPMSAARVVGDESCVRTVTATYAEIDRSTQGASTSGAHVRLQ